MNKKQIVKQIKKLSVAFPSKKTFETEEELDLLLELWEDCLGMYTDEVVSMAIRNYILDNTYAPTIADIDREVHKIKSDYSNKIEMLTQYIRQESQILLCEKAMRDGEKSKRIESWQKELDELKGFKIYDYDD